MRLRFFLFLIFILGLMITSCSSRSTSPVPVSNSNLKLTQELMFDKHKETAFQAYERAKQDALRWNKEAVLYEIPPTRLMENNLGLGPGGPIGWFFMFKANDSPVELYVEVVDGKVIGRTEAQPIIVGDLPYETNPLDIKSILIDSNDALQIYLKDGGEQNLSNNKNIILDYRLIFITGTNHPVWSIFNTQDFTNPLYNVDAITGEKTQNPFEMAK